MSGHFFLKLIVFLVVGAFVLNTLAPGTFDDAKDNIGEIIAQQFNETVDSIEDLIGNSSQFEEINNITYLNLGGITTENPCIDEMECNENINNCQNECLCSESGVCLKPI